MITLTPTLLFDYFYLLLCIRNSLSTGGGRNGENRGGLKDKSGKESVKKSKIKRYIKFIRHGLLTTRVSDLKFSLPSPSPKKPLVFFSYSLSFSPFVNSYKLLSGVTVV